MGSLYFVDVYVQFALQPADGPLEPPQGQPIMGPQQIQMLQHLQQNQVI